MPLIMAPKPEENTETADLTPDGWETDGPKREYFTILVYTDPAVVKAAQDAARKTTAGGNGRVAEEQNAVVLRHHLFTSQLKGWRVLVAPGTDLARYKDRIQEEEGYLFWKFLPINVAELPVGAAMWLTEQILARDGTLASSKLITVADDKTLHDFRQPQEELVHGKAPRGADTERD